MILSGESAARLARPLFQVEGSGSIPTSPLQFILARTSRQKFSTLNKLWHSRLPKIGCSQGRVFHAAEFEGVIFAVAMWSNPVARLLPQLTWMELRRFAIAHDAPKNTASRMLGWMVNDIRRGFPEVVKLISYQDLATHKGTIYKAAGWHEAKGYKPRARGCKPTAGWASRYRAGRTDQAASSLMRWELDLNHALRAARAPQNREGDR